MAKIKAPNKDYTGVSASVSFSNGIGETNDPALIRWFRRHGYAVEVEKTPEAVPAAFTDDTAWIPEEKPKPKRTRKRSGK